jgi:hypothetical protein
MLKNPLFTIAGLLTAVLLLIGVFYLRHASVAPTTTPIEPAAPSGPSPRIAAQNPIVTAPRVDAASPRPQPSTTVAVTLLKERLAEKLSDYETHLLDVKYQSLLETIQQIELTLADREEVEPGVVLITIPEYYEKGLEAFADFAESLATVLGAKRAKEILTDFERLAVTEANGLGASEQTILVEWKGSEYRVVRGSGSVISVDNRPMLAKGTSISQLLPGRLLSYSHLSPLFPSAQQ